MISLTPRWFSIIFWAESQTVMRGTFISLLLTSLISVSSTTSISDGTGPASVRLVSGMSVSVLHKIVLHRGESRSLCGLVVWSLSWENRHQCWARPGKSIIQILKWGVEVRSGFCFNTIHSVGYCKLGVKDFLFLVYLMLYRESTVHQSKVSYKRKVTEGVLVVLWASKEFDLKNRVCVLSPTNTLW